jgi:hypothetical protein
MDAGSCSVSPMAQPPPPPPPHVLILQPLIRQRHRNVPRVFGLLPPPLSPIDDSLEDVLLNKIFAAVEGGGAKFVVGGNTWAPCAFVRVVVPRRCGRVNVGATGMNKKARGGEGGSEYAAEWASFFRASEGSYQAGERAMFRS